jgi:hypothetical protein
MLYFKRTFALIALLTTVLVLGACQPAGTANQGTAPSSSSAAEIPQITISARDYAYVGPTQIPAGLVSLTLVNDGKEPHQAQLARLNDGVTMDQIQAALQKGPEAAIPLVSLAGGPSVVMPGKQQQVTVDLAEGQYVMLCFVESPDGMPHLAKGMISPLQVTRGTGQARPEEPKADATVTMKDFTFQMPSQIKAGRFTWKVVNDGPQPHEMSIVKLAPGKTLDDVMAVMASQSFSGPPPFEEAGGMQALDAGKTGWLTLDLEPGSYLALCFVPDPASGRAHVEMGMVVPFSVS